MAASFPPFGNVLQATEVETSAVEESPLVYRRIFVPADKLDAWPREGEKFIPIEARDFEAWVASANRATAGQDRAATIDSATYSATLEDDGRLRGRGQWSISVHDSQPSYLPLGHTTLVLREPRWASAPEQPVRLGAWGNSEQPSSRVGMRAPRSGTLEFKWSISPRAGRDTIEFPWHVPAAVSTRLALDLPEEMEPAIAWATVLESIAMPPAGDDKHRRHWLLAVSSTPNATLRIKTDTREPGHQVVNSADPFTLHETTNYRVEQRGVELTATWILEGASRNQRELTLPVQRGVQITSVAIDGRELDWQFVRNATPGTDRAIIPLPTFSDHGALEIVVTAWHPLVLDRPWRLPILRPNGAFWSSGRIELAISPEFELQRFDPAECAQTGETQFGTDVTKPEVYSLTAYSSAAAVEVAITRRQPDATLRVGSSLVLADQDVSGRLATAWNVAGTGLHRLSGELAAGWSVETVETIPADALAEWFIDRRGGRRQLEIQLTDAASPARKITVVVMGRLQRFSLAEPIPAETLKMVHWSGARVARHLLTFQSSEPFTVEPVGELPTLSRELVTDFDRDLLDAAANERPVVDLARAGSGAGLQLSFKRGSYSADVELDATYTGSELRQLFRITAHPRANAVDRLLIYSTAPLAKSTRWIEKTTESPLTADRLPTDSPQYRDLPKQGELWLLRLPQPTAGTIEVSASATVAWPHRESPPLFAFPEATEQRGRVIVRSLADATPSVEPVGLAPTPRPLDGPAAGRADETSQIRAAFRFDPAECLRSPRAPRLWIGPEEKDGTNPLVARYLDLESFCWPDGRATHRATYELENYGTSEFNPALPSGARLTFVTVNGQSLETPHSDTREQPMTIRLPPHSDTATVAVYFETRQSPLAAGGNVSPPLVRNGTPLLAGEWTIWLPEEYSARTASQSSGGGIDWRKRLFGPFARSRDVAAFYPLQLSDWARLVNGVADWPFASGRDSAPSNPTEIARSEPMRIAPSTASQPKPVATDSSKTASRPADSTDMSTPGNPLPGWRAFHETFVADGVPEPFVVLHPPATTAWAVAILFAAFLLGRRLCSERGTLLLILASIAACLALLLPAALAPLATGALWGLLLSHVAEWPRKLISLDRATGNGSRQAPIIGVLVVAAGCSLAQNAFAAPASQQPAASAARAPTRVERVLIPVDADRRPAGAKYFVSERFLRGLLAAASEQAATANEWLLIDATYAGELIAQREQNDMVAGTWALAFSLETFARDTTIVLPLARDEANWQPTAMLDGVPLPLHWLPATGGCAVDIEQPGRYSLTIFCVPKTATAEGRCHFRLTVPPLVSATFELHAPAALTGITVPGAVLGPASKASPGVRSGELGPAAQLAVEWPRLEPKSEAAQGATVTALSWLHVGERQIELETKYIIEGGARRPETLAVSYDERWRPVGSPAAGNERPVDAASGRRSLTVALPANNAERQEISLRWRLAGAPSIGAVRLPPIELSSIVPTQHWFALSADPSLDCAVENKSATSATAKEFLAKWGASPASTPQLVFPKFDAVGDCTLTVRPHAAESTVREVLHVAVGKKSMRVVYQANVSPDARSEYQFQLAAPAGLNVDEIAVIAGERRIPIRWVRDATGHINIFFGEKPASDYRLSLTGTAPLGDGKPSRLPRVTAAGAGASTQQLQLYRDDDVQVDLQGLPPAEESSAWLSDLPPVQWLVRPLGIYHLDEAAAAAARVAVTHSQPKVAGDSLTILSREAGAWWATFRCRLSTKAEGLDMLRLRVPAAWSGPFDIESNIPVTTEITPLDAHRQTLAVRVAATIAKGDHLDVQIRAPLATPASSAPFLPDIALELPAEGHRYAIVPTSLDSQPISWTETGVRTADVPKALLPAYFDAAKQRQLEIVDEPFRVSVNTRALRRASPRIRLADTTVSVGERGGELVVTRLILASDGLTECTLQLPANDELVSVKIDGRPALHSALDAADWRVVLGAAHLPQLLEVVSRSPASESSRSPSDLRRPTLLAGNRLVPVEISLWTIGEPRRFTGVQIADAAEVSPLDQAALRIDRLASIVEAATATAAESPAPDGDNWSRVWAAIVRDVQAQTERLRSQPATGPAAAQVSRTSEEQLDGASKRLDAWLQQVSAQQEASAAAPANTSRQATASPWMPPIDSAVKCYVAEGGTDRLAVQAARTNATPLQTHLMPLVSIACLAVAIAWLIRSPAAADLVCRWPHAIGVLIGILWWAWLSPSWLGFAIIAASVWHALRFDWPGRSFRAEASTVLRSTRTH